MDLDQVGIPIRNHDYVVELDEEFARYGEEGKDLQYGIIFGSKWILPLNGTRKRQIVSSTCVKLLNKELKPEIKKQLDALYMYYRKYDQLPEVGVDIVELMEQDVKDYTETQYTVIKPISPFVPDLTTNQVIWANDSSDTDNDIEEDDLF